MMLLGIVITLLTFVAGVANIVFFFKNHDNTGLKYYVFTKGLICLYIAFMWGIDVLDDYWTLKGHMWEFFQYKRIGIFCMALVLFFDVLARKVRTASILEDKQ